MHIIKCLDETVNLLLVEPLRWWECVRTEKFDICWVDMGYAQSFNTRLCVLVPQVTSLYWRAVSTKRCFLLQLSTERRCLLSAWSKTRLHGVTKGGAGPERMWATFPHLFRSNLTWKCVFLFRFLVCSIRRRINEQMTNYLLRSTLA